uniref:DRBM domain-containing protein n=1 Tax=Periophthalmus magnuspinnatus TaxID=409849 RepID=A0A3B4AQD3_9GOBI
CLAAHPSLFELGTKLGLPVAFTELKREGPLHNDTFSFKVTVGDFTGVGEGQSIPLAKKLAAEKVLPDLHMGALLAPSILAPIHFQLKNCHASLCNCCGQAHHFGLKMFALIHSMILVVLFCYCVCQLRYER